MLDEECEHKGNDCTSGELAPWDGIMLCPRHVEEMENEANADYLDDGSGL